MAQISARVLNAALRFVRNVEKTGVRLHAAYLFGSYATGHAHRYSDIDIALVSPDFTGWVDDLEKIRDATRTMDHRIEMVRFRPDTFVDENPLAWEVKTKGVSLLSNHKRAQSATHPLKTRATRSSLTRAKRRQG